MTNNLIKLISNKIDLVMLNKSIVNNEFYEHDYRR